MHSLDSPSAIRARLAELDREWNVDRAVMLAAAIATGLTGLLARKHVVWRAIHLAQLGLLGYYAIARWCPPLPVLRKMGFRSDHEIASERVALEKRLVELRR